MAASRKTRCIIISVLVLIMAAIPMQAQNPGSDQLLKNVPADSLFCIRINNFTNSLTQVDQFITGISPGVSISMLAQSQMSNLLGSPKLDGLNMNGNFAAFGMVMNSQSTQPGEIPDVFLGVLAPVSNYKQFIDGISSKTPVDANGVVKILSVGNPVLLVSQLGGYAIFTHSNEYNGLLLYKKRVSSSTTGTASLGSALDAAEAKRAASEPVWIYGNIQQASKTFGPVITEGINTFKAILGSVPSASTGISTEGMQSIMNMYVSVIETFLKETKSLSVSLNPSSTAFNMTSVISTVPGTNMAKMFASNPSAQQNSLLPYLEDGSMMNMAFMTNSPIFKQTIDMQTNLISIMTGEKITQDNLQKMKALAQSVLDCVSGPAAYTFTIDTSSKPPFKGKFLIAVKDEKKFQQLIGESTDLMTKIGIFDFYKTMGIDASYNINRNVETYKGVSIDSAKLSMKFTDANNPEAKKMIDEMYGSGFEYRWGIVNGLFAAAVGSDSNKTLHELIDQIQAGGAKQLGSETKAALSLVPGADKADFLVTMNLPRLMKVGMAMVSSIAPIPAATADIKSNSNVVIDGQTDNGKLTVNFALPKEQVQEVMQSIQSVRQQPQPPTPAQTPVTTPAQPPVSPRTR